jgi:hypothetical protein
MNFIFIFVFRAINCFQIKFRMKPNFELSVVELLGNAFHLVVGMAV